MAGAAFFIGLLLFVATVQFPHGAEASMANFMNEDEAIEKYGMFVDVAKSRILGLGFDIGRYDLLVRDDGETLLFSFVYNDKPKGLRGSDPRYPDTNFVVNRKSGEIVRKYFSR